MKILVVEDDTVSMKLIVNILNKAGYDTIAAADVASARELLETNTGIGLIISDIMMPKEDGFDLLRYLKSKPKLNHIPVLMCTALGDKEAVMKSISLGARDFIVKPVQAENLRAKVSRVLGNHGKSILVVDDEKAIREVLRVTLERSGYNVYTAESGAKALEMIKEHPVNLVISDIVMPEMSGIDLLHHLKKDHPDLPVYLITGMGRQYREKEVLSEGADGFISKPFSNLDILSSVRTHLGGVETEKNGPASEKKADMSN